MYARLRSTMAGKKKHILIGIGVVVVVLSAVIATIVVLTSGKAKEEHKPKPFEFGPIDIRLKKAMNESVDPCEDFYQYACGGWISSHNPGVSISTYALNKFSKLIPESKDRTLYGSDDLKDFTRTFLKDYYDHCNSVGSRKQNVDFFMEILEKYNHGWPLAKKDWNDTGYDWMKAEASIGAFTTSRTFMRLDAVIDQRNTSTYILGMKLLPSLFDIQLLDNQIEIAKYKKYYRMVAAYFRNDSSERTLKEIDAQIDDMFSLCRKWISAVVSDSSGIQTTFEELESNAPQIPWLKWAQTSLDMMFGEGKFPLSKGSTLIINNLDNYRKFAEFFYSEKPKNRDIANLIGIKILANTQALFDEPVWSLYTDLLKEVTSDYKLESQSQACFDFGISQNFEPFFSRLLVLYHKHIQENIKKAEELSRQIKEGFLKQVDNTTWIHLDTKRQITEKIRNIEADIGLGKYVTEEKVLKDMFGLNNPEAENRKQSFLSRRWFILRSQDKFEQGKILRIRNPREDKFLTNFLRLDALYNRNFLKVVIYVPYIGEPFFYEDAPWYYNYGQLGFVTGHEFGHSLDSESRFIDAKGNEVGPNWWNNTSWGIYDKKIQCLVEQYHSDFQSIYNSTIKEDMADLMGIRNAYKAYKNKVKNITEEVLPLFRDRFTQDQLFFISFANLWCEKPKENSASNRLPSYSPNNVRVNGPLRNFEAFARTFNCSAKSFMVAKNPCVLWGGD